MMLRVALKLKTGIRVGGGGGGARRLFLFPTGSQRYSSEASNDLVSTRLDPFTGIAELTMNNLPVNSLSLEMCLALTDSIKEAESDPKIQALILQSGSLSTFSAGLDLAEMHNPEPERLKAFWTSFQNVYFSLYGSRLACIAAIEGHAPAAGCMLALSCDFRIMAATDNDSKPSIGLNEAKFGLVAPPFLAGQMIDTVGIRQAELALSLGTLYSSEEALAMKLIDRVVAKDQVRASALAEAARWVAIPAHARFAGKQLVRQPRIDTLRANVEHDVSNFVGFVTNAKVQQGLSAYLAMLAKKGKK